MVAASDCELADESALVSLRVDVPQGVRREIKSRAALEGVRMQDLVRDLIYRGLMSTDRPDSSR